MATLDQIIADLLRAEDNGEQLDRETWAARHPEYADAIRQFFADGEWVGVRLDVPSSDGTRSLEGAQAGQHIARVSPTLPFIPGYELIREIHRGGQGVVYLALQLSTQRQVAVKVMKHGPFAGAMERARFDREVRILARLRHPFIVTIHDSGSVADWFYLVMDYIEGPRLDEFVDDIKSQARGTIFKDVDGSRRPVTEKLLELFCSICDAVNAAHIRGVLHRDLKPSNIRIGPGGEPRILDFGLAKNLDEGSTTDTTSEVLTMSGQFVGSLPWSSPEQAQGRPDSIDIRTDVYSLGVILYQALTGRFPYEVTGGMLDVLHNIVHVDPMRPGTIVPSLDDELETIILRCLHKERERRYQTAGELARDIRHYLAGEPIEAKSGSTFYMLRKQLRRFRVPLGMAAAVVLLVFAFGLGMLNFARKEAEAKRNAIVARDDADKARTEAEFRSYLAGIAAAQSALAANDADTAIRNLEHAPAPFRNWEWRHLAAQVDESEQTIEAFNTWAAGLAISPDGTLVATSSAKGTIKLFESSGQEVMVLAGHEDFVGRVEFDPSGTKLATASRDLTVRVWDVSAGQTLVVFDTGDSWLKGITFTPDGACLIGGALDGWVRVWDASTGDMVRSWKAHDSEIYSLAPSPDGVLLATGTQDGRLALWDTATGTSRFVVSQGHQSYISDLHFNNDGSRLVTAGGDGAICLWGVASRQRLLTIWSPGTENVGCVRFSPDGNLIASGGHDNAVRLWDAQSGRLLNTFIGHRQRVLRLRFTPDGSQVLSSSLDGTVRYWPSSGYGAQLRMPVATTDVLSLALSPDGSSLLVGTSDSRATIWDVRSSQVTQTLAGHEDFVMAVGWREDGRRVATASWDNSVRVWDPDDGRELAIQREHQQRINAVEYSSEGVLASVDDAGQIILWNPNESCLQQITGSEKPLHAVRVSPVGSLLATSGDDGVIRLWTIADGRWNGNLDGHSHSVKALAFSPDGTRLASGGGDDFIKVWDVEKRVCIRELSGAHAREVRSLVFLADGSRLASCSLDGAVKLWDPASGVQVLTFRTASAFPRTLTFNDARCCLAVGLRGMVQLFEAPPDAHLSGQDSVPEQESTVEAARD